MGGPQKAANAVQSQQYCRYPPSDGLWYGRLIVMDLTCSLIGSRGQRMNDGCTVREGDAQFQDEIETALFPTLE